MSFSKSEVLVTTFDRLAEDIRAYGPRFGNVVVEGRGDDVVGVEFPPLQAGVVAFPGNSWSRRNLLPIPSHRDYWSTLTGCRFVRWSVTEWLVGTTRLVGCELIDCDVAVDSAAASWESCVWSGRVRGRVEGRVTGEWRRLTRRRRNVWSNMDLSEASVGYPDLWFDDVDLASTALRPGSQALFDPRTDRDRIERAAAIGRQQAPELADALGDHLTVLCTRVSSPQVIQVPASRRATKSNRAIQDLSRLYVEQTREPS